ncbi:hypothetical protein [Terribacillus saccharophilus]|nr:hypothetical protein [Terribacillus saccharophilus]
MKKRSIKVSKPDGFIATLFYKIEHLKDFLYFVGKRGNGLDIVQIYIGY